MLSVYMLMVAVNQLLWITFAPITSDAVSFYGVSDIKIGMLSMSFMLVYLIVSIPASWIIDTYGIKRGVGIGVLMTGVFGMSRGLFSENYNMLLLSQIGIAIGQPFLLNAITKIAARWFPLEERATASGLGTLAMYLGILGGMVITPYLLIGSGMQGMLYKYGLISVVASVIFLVFAKERPKTAPCRPEDEERALVIDGFRLIFKSKDFNWLLVIFFIGLGVFNAVTTWVENILGPRGFTPVQAGVTGGLMIMGGIIGAVIIPLLSDYYRRRIPFIIIALTGASLGLIGLSFSTNYMLLLVSGAAFGFFLLSSGPVGFQYGAEITHPVSEGTSNGFLILMGQVSGIAFIFGMDSLKSAETGSMMLPLMILIALMLLGTVFSTRLKESKLLVNSNAERK